MTEDELCTRHDQGYEALKIVQGLQREGMDWTVLLDALIVHIQDQPNAPVWLPAELEKIVDQMEVDSI